MSSEPNTTDDTDESKEELAQRVARLEQQVSDQADGVSRREALVGGGLLGLGLLGGGATGGAAASLDGDPGDAMAVGGSLSVDDSYHIAGDLYAGPQSARPASADTNATSPTPAATT